MIETLAVVCGGQLVARLANAVIVVKSSALVDLLLRQRSSVRRAMAWALALLAPPLIAAVTEPVRGSLELSGYLTIALLVVVVVALLGGVRPALLAVVAAWLSGDYVFATPYNSFRIYLRAGNAPLVAFILVGAAVGLLVDQLVRLLDEQTALRRVETALRIELDASRARIVAASDQTRRRIERDLHDGTQQRLVSLGLEVRSAISAVPAQLPELGADLARIAAGLASVQEELREIVRGIHPAILAMGGIGPALRTLARRSAVPVELDVRTQARLPERVEVATYYIVSEALTNTAKHAQASAVRVDVEAVDGVIRIAVADDGVGGAEKSKGSGLVGLKDRIEALGGAIAIDSPAGQGTKLRVEIPVGD
jgi:signal transduction histidine kinase